jgi:hypothetical protein
MVPGSEFNFLSFLMKYQPHFLDPPPDPNLQIQKPAPRKSRFFPPAGFDKRGAGGGTRQSLDLFGKNDTHPIHIP